MKKSLLPVKNVKGSGSQNLGKEELLKLLRRYFGYSGFRGKQFEAIDAVLSGRDCFCLMPTGGGKSMCYQIPAVAKPGIVLVISPLIALMENQVDILRKKGILAEFLSSTLAVAAKQKIYEDLNSGKPSVRLLYVTPELVATVGFTAKLKKLHERGLLSLIAVDEAHCISSWGHDFRPSYRKLSLLRSYLPGVPILALTATAIPKVQMDVIGSLSLQQPLVLKASFNRPNIFYEVRYKDLLNDTYSDLSNLLKSSGEVCSIVYCLERSTCEDLSAYLTKNGISSAVYHAGLSSKLRSTVLENWISSKIQVVVATVAFAQDYLYESEYFGNSIRMGIDRKDVRIVCHLNVPKSMESFYQESGRAGRDQLPSRSVLYYGLDDRKRMEFILRNTTGKKKESSSHSSGLSEKSLAAFKQMVEYCEGSGCRRQKILETFGEKVPPSFCQKSCDSCKYPNLVLQHLREVQSKSYSHKKDNLFPIFIKSSTHAALEGEEMELFSHEDEDNSLGEEISDSEDGDVASNITRSKMPTDAALNEKYEILERAEEAYYRNKGPSKQAFCDKKAISDTLRKEIKNRFLNVLNQANDRLQKLPLGGFSCLLEMECFSKYGKVGKTFYNSQVAATLRWLSHSNTEQILDRLNNISTSTGSECGQDKHSIGPDSSTNQDAIQAEATNEENNQYSSLLDVHGLLEIKDCSEKIDLPPIPSFSEFASKKRREHGSGSSSVRNICHGKPASENAVKRMRLN